MKKFVVIDKKIGETPLQALEIFRQQTGNLVGVPITYAGRLDPMAEGKLLLLLGEECKNRKKYDGLDKEYEFEVLVGLKTDSGDVLGLVDNVENVKQITLKDADIVAKSFVGKNSFPYPNFSSKTVNGKQMFEHTLNNNLYNIELPLTKSFIYKIDFLGMRKISIQDIFDNVISKINKLKTEDNGKTGSDFRKIEIIERWNKIKEENIGKDFIVLKYKTVVSSGTYIRTLSEKLAEKFGSVGLAYSIKRTKIGKFTSIFSLCFWRKIYK